MICACNHDDCGWCRMVRTRGGIMADRLLVIAARLSTQSPLGWSRPDCVTLEEAARLLRGEAEPKPDGDRVDAVLST